MYWLYISLNAPPANSNSQNDIMKIRFSNFLSTVYYIFPGCQQGEVYIYSGTDDAHYHDGDDDYKLTLIEVMHLYCFVVFGCSNTY